MTHYHFVSEDFALSDEGIHLLRNSFNYKTIPYNQVKKAVAGRGTEVKRPLLIIGFGMLLLWFGGSVAAALYRQWLQPTVYHIDIKIIILPLLPFLVGMYCFFMAFKKGPVLKVEEERAVHSLRLRTFYKKKQQAALLEYLSARLDATKMVVAVSVT